MCPDVDGILAQLRPDGGLGGCGQHGRDPGMSRVDDGAVAAPDEPLRCCEAAFVGEVGCQLLSPVILFGEPGLDGPDEVLA